MKHSERNAHEMLAARLHGPSDLRIDTIPLPEAPGEGQLLLKVTAVAVCGSDLHVYRHAKIGDTSLEGPLVLGHEFGGKVEAINVKENNGQCTPMPPGTRVAVDPAFPCGKCEWCLRGDPNLCIDLPFCGLWPTQGALTQWMSLPVENCFPVPDSISDACIPLLEPLGVAIHTIDLAKVRLGQSAVVLGAGPIGLCILQALRIAGCHPIFVVEPLSWRREMALELGADEVICPEEEDAPAAVLKATGSRGVDIAIEAAHGGIAAEQAVEMAAHGGKVLLVGIDPDDRVLFRHSAGRRKGLTLLMVRRMKHTYPRAIELVEKWGVELEPLITHRFPLRRAEEAFRINADYGEEIIKAIIELPESETSSA
jgi:L-iditol 2-dehydrogenase